MKRGKAGHGRDHPLILTGARWLSGFCSIVLIEPPRGLRKQQPDVIGWVSTTWDSVVLEVKDSANGMKVDRYKPHHRPGSNGVGVMRYYLVPGAISSRIRIPSGWDWGLLSSDETGQITKLVECRPRQTAEELRPIQRNEGLLLDEVKKDFATKEPRYTYVPPGADPNALAETAARMAHRFLGWL